MAKVLQNCDMDHPGVAKLMFERDGSRTLFSNSGMIYAPMEYLNYLFFLLLRFSVSFIPL